MRMQEEKIQTSDHVELALNLYETGHKEVLIIAPGWCMTKDSKAFAEMADEFSKTYDVISFDFRGHGRSKGWYTFTARELFDLAAVVDFAKTKYEKINLMGFSLGGGIALIFAAFYPFLSKLIAVSAYCDFDKIENCMWKKEAWSETFRKFELGRFLSIRPYPLPLKKVKPIDVVKYVNVPTLFIAGKHDPTVKPWHTETLWKNAMCEKEFKLYKDGRHAEDLFLHFKKEFVEDCNNWLIK